MKSNKILKHFLQWAVCMMFGMNWPHISRNFGSFRLLVAISVFSLEILRLYIFHNLMWYVYFHTSLCITKFPHIKCVILVTKFPQSLKIFRNPGLPRLQLFQCLNIYSGFRVYKLAEKGDWQKGVICKTKRISLDLLVNVYIECLIAINYDITEQ